MLRLPNWGQICLRANIGYRYIPVSSCASFHVKLRLLGHWGTSPGLNFIYAHLNRIIRLQDANMIYVCGPGHGGPAMVANT